MQSGEREGVTGLGGRGEGDVARPSLPHQINSRALCVAMLSQDLLSLRPESCVVHILLHGELREALEESTYREDPNTLPVVHAIPNASRVQAWRELQLCALLRGATAASSGLAHCHLPSLGFWNTSTIRRGSPPNRGLCSRFLHVRGSTPARVDPGDGLDVRCLGQGEAWPPAA